MILRLIKVAVVDWTTATSHWLLRKVNRVILFVPFTCEGEKMKMGANQVKHRSGVAFHKVMAASAVLVVAAVGALSYEYPASRSTQVARAHIAAPHRGPTPAGWHDYRAEN